MALRIFLVLLFGSLAGCSVTPSPLTQDEHRQRVFDDVARLQQTSVALTEPLLLEEAIARGILYNFDHKVQIMEEVLQRSQLTLANIDMLPTLAADAGYNIRSTEDATSSITLFSNRKSLEPSYSEEKEVLDANLTFSWNILDFGLSYYRAKQQADRALIAIEKRRRVMNNLVIQIESAYWQALTAQRLLPKVNRVIREAEQAERRAAQSVEEGLQSNVAALEYRRNLVQVISALKGLKSSLSVSKSRLASLINLPAGTSYQLSGPRDVSLPRLDVSLADLQNFGLIYRPELREEAYQARIDRETVNQEILNMFPGLSIIASVNYSSNDLRYANDWREAGLSATWNLINVLRGPRAVRTAREGVKISDARRLALTSAVLVQVSIGNTEYFQAVDGYASANKLSRIEREMLNIAKKAEASEDGTVLDRIQREAQSISAELTRDSAYTDARLSFARLMLSIGLDLVPPSLAGNDLDQTVSQVRAFREQTSNNRLSTILNTRLNANEQPSETTAQLR